MYLYYGVIYDNFCFFKVNFSYNCYINCRHNAVIFQSISSIDLNELNANH